MIDFKIVTVCNRIPEEPYYLLKEFIKSISNNTPLVLGRHPGEYGGLGSKMRLLHKALKEGLVKEKYTVFCDCWDLVFAVPPEELVIEYLEFDIPLVVSAEKNCFPADLKEEYDRLPYTSNYRYLNSGMIVGETEALYTLLCAMDAENMPNDYWDAEKQIQVNPNDQFEYQKIFLKQPVPIALDYDQILCNTLHDVKEEELNFVGERIRNKETRYFPCSFHANGGAKTSGIVPPILKHLNL